MPLTELTCRTAKPGHPGAQIVGWGRAPALGDAERVEAVAACLSLRRPAETHGDRPLSGHRSGRRPPDSRCGPSRNFGRSRSGRARREARAAEIETFRAVADEYLEKLRRDRRADTTLSKVGWLLDQACESLGDRGVAGITAPQVLAALRTVERRGRHETANRLRGGRRPPAPARSAPAGRAPARNDRGAAAPRLG